MGSGQSLPKVTAQDRAILDLKLQRNKLKQYQKKIQIVLDREQAIARECLAAGNKDKALTALRRRKYQAGLLSKTDSQLETLENLVSSIEFSLVEKDVMFGLQQGNQVLKELHKEMSVESVEKLMGETEEAIAYQREINELLESRMTLDEEESVQHELEQMQRHAAPVLKVDEPPVNLPDVPVAVPLDHEEQVAPPTPDKAKIPEKRVALAA